MNGDLYIIKVGSNALIDKDGEIRDSVVAEILSVAKEAEDRGDRALIVTSGAARMGRKVLNNPMTNKKIPCSVGNPIVFEKYRKLALKEKIFIAEILLTRSYVVRRDLFLPLKATLNEMFANKIVPVVNENDVLVQGTDLAFGDNDSIAQALAVSLEAKKVIIVSDIEGFYDGDPKLTTSKIIPEVDDITDHFIACCTASSSGHGSGGMLSKLKSIRICTAVGVEAWIVSGLKKGNIRKAFLGEPVGTKFKARDLSKKVSGRERWILAAKSSTGSIVIDDGAIQAIRGGASLLAVGVKKVYGSFNEKEVIEIVDMKNRGIAFGIVDMSVPEIEDMLRTKETHKKLLVHANNMFFLN
jgi:glutamate 5-kinase